MRGKVESWTKKNKFTVGVYLILVFLVLYVLIQQILKSNYENVLLCALTLVLFLTPSFLERKMNIIIPTALEILILLFIFFAQILGEIYFFYLKYWFWDDMLHAINGFFGAAVGIFLIDILNKKGRFSLSLNPIFVSVFAFCFSMSVGVLWEFFEFGMDQFFLFDMQKDTLLSQSPYVDIGLIDTMRDLSVNFIGAFIFSVMGFFYVRHGEKSKIISSFIPKYD